MIRNTLGLFSMLLTLAACGSSAAPQPSIAASSGCDQIKDSQAVLDTFYAPGTVYSARKIEKTEFVARAVQPRRVVGADLYVHAQPDLSQAYLERVLTCHAASGKPAHPNDPLHPADGQVAELSVRTVGSSLAVRVVGEDSRTGREIFERAKAFTGPSDSVTVEQVASTGTPRSF